ncbi:MULTISPECIES: RNA-binding S4 domain-containing protein [unclassified Pseudochrobactrum]|uniref:RNA-binding S4 domain-containing protein n=1 Tax=unclassified Pseudochrobactrum TaxID=2647013 RepID=UPI00039B816E|nr:MULTISPECIES: RNA-binding S4 domain-containing protein [unclassified Pseudochrobactrum]UCA45316.1 RNA-binding S4 domain-containing protein [Pseudochrobactrum sp. XF203]
MNTGALKQRIDKWLFFTRVVKSRSLAAKLAAGGRVRINRDKIDQASHGIKIGDVVTVTLDRRILIYKVRELGERRGSFPEAQLLYEDLTPPAEKTEEQMAAVGEKRDAGSGRPTKRDRRATERLKQGGSGFDEF